MFITIFATILSIAIIYTVFFIPKLAHPNITHTLHHATDPPECDFKYIGSLLNNKTRNHFLKLFARHRERNKWEYYIIFKDSYGMLSEKHYLRPSINLIDNESTIYVPLFNDMYTFYKQHTDMYPYQNY